MRRKKSLKKNPNLKDYFDRFDYQTLVGILNTFRDSEGWDVFKAYLQKQQREFEVAALDLVKHPGQQHMAAHASGYAQGLQDVVEKMIPDLIDVVLGKTQVIEAPPQDVELQEHPSVEG